MKRITLALFAASFVLFIVSLASFSPAHSKPPGRNIGLISGGYHCSFAEPSLSASMTFRSLGIPSENVSISLSRYRVAGSSECQRMAMEVEAFAQSLGCSTFSITRATSFEVNIVCEDEVDEVIRIAGDLFRLVQSL